MNGPDPALVELNDALLNLYKDVVVYNRLKNKTFLFACLRRFFIYYKGATGSGVTV